MLNGLMVRLRALVRATRFDQEIDEELRMHLESRTEQLIVHGLTSEEARVEARREMGNVTSIKEQSREALGVRWIEDAVSDVRYGLRGLLKTPLSTAVILVTLALGIGANTAIFTLIDVAMIKSLPVSHPEELVMLTLNAAGASKGSSSFSQSLWEQIRDHQDVFAGLFAYGSTSADLGVGGEVRPIAVGLVSGDFFSTLGVGPAAGRFLTSADDQRGCPGIAVITHAFWQSEYGSSERVVGRSVAINGQPFEIVGVAAPAFFGVEFGYYAPVWAPQCAGTILRPGGAYSGGGRVIGRLKPGVTLEQSRARLAALAPSVLDATLPPNLSAQAAVQYRRSTFDVTPFSRGLPSISRSYVEALFILMTIVGVVLLIACANVANLLLARATSRRHEIALRLALGASRFRLIRQLLTESVLLSLVGAALGVLLANWGSRAIVGFLARRNQVMLLDLTPDLNVLAFTIAVGVLTGVLFGLAPAFAFPASAGSRRSLGRGGPAWRAVRVELLAAMTPGGRGVAAGHSRFGVGKALVVAQIALSLVMITGAGLLIGSWQRLATLDPGFRSAGVLLAGVNTRPAGIPADQLGDTYRRILERLRAIPGVAAASAAAITPFGTTNMQLVIAVEGYTSTPGDDTSVRLNNVSDGYFATIGTRLLAGRDFNGGDVPGSPAVAIVNEELARRFFGGARPGSTGAEAAIGQHFRVKVGNGLSPPVEIVGIAANTKEVDLHESSLPIVYYALSQYTQPNPGNYVLRTEGSPSALMPSVKAALAEISPRFFIDLRTLQQQVDESLRLRRTLGMLAGFFGGLALLLAAIGLYGLISYTVARRRNEIGVRIALGAAPSRIIRMVLGDVGGLVGAGVVIGVLLSLAVTRLVSTFLYGVAAHDPATLALSAFTLAAVAIGAALLPACRAASVDPMVALRCE